MFVVCHKHECANKYYKFLSIEFQHQTIIYKKPYHNQALPIINHDQIHALSWRTRPCIHMWPMLNIFLDNKDASSFWVRITNLYWESVQGKIDLMIGIIGLTIIRSPLTNYSHILIKTWTFIAIISHQYFCFSISLMVCSRHKSALSYGHNLHKIWLLSHEQSKNSCRRP